MTNDRDLRGAVAVVTGAASGIGRATAFALAKQGCTIALADIDAARLYQTQADLSDIGVKTLATELDVTDRVSIRDFAARVEAELGGASILINNAGAALVGRFDQLDEKDFDALLSLNLGSVVDMTRAFLPQMRAQPWAALVNVSSVFGLVGQGGQTAYSTAKFGVRGFTEALRQELVGTSISVTGAYPGGVRTNIAGNARLGSSASAKELAWQRDAAHRFSKTSAEAAAAKILRGIRRGQARILIGPDAALISVLARIFPVEHWRLLEPFIPKPPP